MKAAEEEAAAEESTLQALRREVEGEQRRMEEMRELAKVAEEKAAAVQAVSSVFQLPPRLKVYVNLIGLVRVGGGFWV